MVMRHVEHGRGGDVVNSWWMGWDLPVRAGMDPVLRCVGCRMVKPLWSVCRRGNFGYFQQSTDLWNGVLTKPAVKT